MKNKDGFARVYAAGFYAFSAAPPFGVTRWSPCPILVPEYEDAPHQCAAATFPAGAVFDGSKWLVSYGYFDAWTHVIELRPDELDTSPNRRQRGRRLVWPDE